MKPRKIVQVAIDPPYEHWGTSVYAVADDGSGWKLERGEWEQLPQLPAADGHPTPRPWLRAEEVREEGFYWAAQPGFSGSEIHEIERRGGFLMAKPIRDEGSDHWYQIHKYGEVWQRIPEPELPKEGES